MCVGCDSVADLRQWQADRALRGEALAHQTRHMPKRADEILAGGSLYWIIKGQVRARQRILALTPGIDGEGRGFCAIGLDGLLIDTIMTPRRPMQGWRYLTEADAPRDRDGHLDQRDEMPPHMLRDLKSLGLL
jgi:hypothetical protein